VIALAVKKRWSIYQLDVKLAFLYGELSKAVSIKQPRGSEIKGSEQKVYKLKKGPLWTETNSTSLVQSYKVIFCERRLCKVSL